MNNVKRIDFSYSLADSDGNRIDGTERDVSVLFNITVISVEEVQELINSGEYEFDRRLVVTTPSRADNLRNR